MHRAFVYLLRRFVFRIKVFLEHWYVKSARLYFNFIVNQLERIDRFFAWRITLRNLFQPLYGDYSVIGYVLGFVIRVIRLGFGGVAYLVIFVFVIGAYLVWLLIPPFLVIGIALNI